MRVDLARIDPDVNMNRFYCVQLTTGLFGDAGVERIWGRRGTRGRHRLDWYQSEPDATAALTRLVQAKIKRGYALARTAARTASVAPMNKTDIGNKQDE